MQITLNQVKNLSYVVIDDLYLPEEVALIKAEIDNLLPHLEEPRVGDTAFDEDDNPQKKGRGLFIDRYYANRTDSAILRLNRKLFCDEIVNKATELNQFFYTLYRCNTDYTLLNCYAAGGEYKPHADKSALSAVTFFALGDIAGGDLVFPESGAVVPFKENRAVIFPGCALHAAQKTIAEPGMFRVSIAQFLNYME